MRALICDICGEIIHSGYREVANKFEDGSNFGNAEHICDDCWLAIADYILEKKEKEGEK